MSQTNIIATLGAYVRDDLPDGSFGASDLYVMDGALKAHAYVKIDLSSIGTGQVATSAILKIKTWVNLNSSSKTMTAKKIESSWDAGITWNTKPSYTGDYDVVPIDSSVLAGDIVDIDITDLVNDWLETPSGNNGVCLFPEAGMTYYTFYSPGHATEENRPVLEVTHQAAEVFVDIADKKVHQRSGTSGDVPIPNGSLPAGDIYAIVKKKSDNSVIVNWQLVKADHTGGAFTGLFISDVPQGYNYYYGLKVGVGGTPIYGSNGWSVGDIWVIADAQSNGVGTLDVGDAERNTAYEQCINATNEVYERLIDPQHFNKGASLSVQFLNKMYDYTGVPQMMISTAVGGSKTTGGNPSDSWGWRNESDHDDPTYIYGDALRKINLMSDGLIRGMITFQGEGDPAATPTVYKEGIEQVIAWFVEDLGYNFPVFIIDSAQVYVASNQDMINLVQAGRRMVDNGVDRLFSVSVYDLEIDIGEDGSKNHLYYWSEDIVGQRLAEIVQLYFDNDLESGYRNKISTSSVSGKYLTLNYDTIKGRSISTIYKDLYEIKNNEYPIVIKNISANGKSVVIETCQTLRGVNELRYARAWNLDRTKAVLDSAGVPMEPVPYYTNVASGEEEINMIGNYFDATDCMWFLNFASWGRGNGTVNKGTGNLSSYPNGVYADWEMIGLDGSGKGYQYISGGDSFLKLDPSKPSKVYGKWPLVLTNTNKFTIASKIRIPNGEAPFTIAGGDATSEYWWISVAANLSVTFLIRVAGQYYYASCNNPFPAWDRDYLMTAIKDEASLKVYLDTTKVADSSVGGVPYAGGDATFANTQNYLGSYYNTEQGLYGTYYWTGLWNKAFSEAEIARYASAPNDLDVIAVDDGSGAMAIYSKIPQSDWSKKIDVTIPAPSASITGMPVVINSLGASALASIQSVAKADGSDIIAVDKATGDLLNSDIINFSNSTVPIIRVKTDFAAAKTIRLLYGNADYTRPLRDTGTYRTAIKTFWPFQEASGTLYDATGTNSDITSNSATLGATARIGKGVEFTATDKWVDCPANSAINGLNAFTYLQWFKATGEVFGAVQANFASIDKTGWTGAEWGIITTLIGGQKTITGYLVDSFNQKILIVEALNTLLDDGEWHLLSMRKAAGTGHEKLMLHIDAVQVDTLWEDDGFVSIVAGTRPLVFGNTDQSLGGVVANAPIGIFDEPRVIAEAISDAELVAIYENEVNGGSGWYSDSLVSESVVSQNMNFGFSFSM